MFCGFSWVGLQLPLLGGLLNLKRFGKMDTLQATVLRALLTKAGWQEYSELVTPDVLTNTNVQAVYAHIAAIHGKSEGDISPEALRLDIQATYRQGESRAEELCDVVSIVARTEEVETNALRDAVQKFVQRELLAQAARQIATTLSDEQLDVHAIGALVTRAMDVGESVHTTVMDALDAALPGEVDDRPGITSLGISTELDSVLGGGVASGELLVFIAPPTRGKTSYICTVGARAAAKGRRVLHVTLEIPAIRVNRRYDSVWTGMTRIEMMKNPKVVGSHRSNVKRNGGRVLIKDWSYRDAGCSPADIKGLVKKLRADGIDIDMVCVDSLELMMPNTSASHDRQALRHSLDRQIKEMRAAAVALQVPVITGWQINRAGSEVDTITMAHVAECFGLNRHADIILGLNQSPNEADIHEMRVGVLKQRDGTARPQVHLRSNLDRCAISDMSQARIYGAGETTDATATV